MNTTTMMPDMETTIMPDIIPIQTTMQPTIPTMQPTMLPMMPTTQPTIQPTQHVNTYRICRWDVILSPNGLNKQPMIYINPDIKFIELMNKHNQILSVEINNTNTMYDREAFYGTVSRSSFIPNFFSKTHMYVVILDCEWSGYPNPSSLGTATFTSPV